MGYQIIVECDCDDQYDAKRIIESISKTRYFILEKIIIYNGIKDVEYNKDMPLNLEDVGYNRDMALNMKDILQINILIYPNQISEDIQKVMKYICNNLIDNNIFKFKIIHSR